MNALRSAIYLVAAIAWTVLLISFSIGKYYPTKFFVGFAMFLSINLFLTCFINSFRKAVKIK